MGPKTLLHSAILTTFGIILLGFITSAPWLYYKLNNQDPGIVSYIGLSIGLLLGGVLLGAITPVFVTKIKSGQDLEAILQAYHTPEY